MIGFSYKNLILQIVHGSVISLTLIFLYDKNLILEGTFSDKSAAIGLFLLASYLLGVVVDFIADILESFALKLIIPPIYYLLTKECWYGIALAHKEYILKHLCEIAAEYKLDHDNTKTDEYYLNRFQRTKPDKEVLNYILQVAKNKAFRVCKDYQKEQIDSFFILYIFSRNISLSLLFAAVALFFGPCIISPFAVLGLVLFTLASSYRYYLYYLRILLGTTIQQEENLKS